MKNIFTLGIISILLFSCSSTTNISEYNLQKKPPFKVLKSTYKNWLGGQPGIKGVLVHLEIDNPNTTLDTIYFINMKSSLDKSQNSSKEIYVGHFTFKNTSNDIILHGDPKKEFGNKVLDISEKIPFELQNNEAVVSYNVKGHTKYVKISNISEESVKNN